MIVYNHDYKPSPIFHSVQNEESTEFYIGMEYEYDDGTVIPNSEWKTILIQQIERNLSPLDYYLKDDCSINGVELVSHPFTYEYWMQYGRIPKICSLGKHLCYTNPEGKAGIHFHVSKKALGKTEEEIDAVEARIVFIIEKFYDYLMEIGQRKKSLYCLRPTTGLSSADSDETAASKAKSCENHNCAINLENSATIEFRFFNATTDWHRVVGYIQLIKVLVEYAKQHSFETVARQNDLTVILDSDYIELNRIINEFVNNQIANRRR